MIGLAQPQTTAAMGYKGVSQPYTNYLNVTTIKTTFLANRFPALPTERLLLMKLKVNILSGKKERTEERRDGRFMKWESPARFL